MKILWLTWKDRSNPLAGGAEVVNEELAKRLVARGHQVTFLVGGFVGGTPEEVRDGYRIIRVGSRFTVYLAAYRYYRDHAAELAPDLVIDECNTMPFFAGWYTGKPTVLFFHMLCRRIWFYEFPQPLSILGWLAEPVYLRLLKRSPVVTISESSRRDLVRQGFDARDIHLISQGIEPAAASLDAPKYAVPTLLSLGAMRAMKRTLHQIKAFELAKAKVPNLRLMVAGDATGSYGQRVLMAIRQSPYAADIEYCGRVSPAEKWELMQRCHAIMVTSVKEGWGLIVTEAASQGTPAVVYDVDGLRDSVRQGITGFIAERNTPRGLADQAVKLLSDPARYERLRAAGSEWSKTITFERSCDDFESILHQTLQDGVHVLPDTETASVRASAK